MRLTSTQQHALNLAATVEHAHLGRRTVSAQRDGGMLVELHAGTAHALERLGLVDVSYPRVTVTERGRKLAGPAS